MGQPDSIRMLWRGAANYQISYRDQIIFLDPLFTRLEGDKPHLTDRREDLERVDYILLTHGHLDHSWDVPYLAAKHDPVVYAPRACLVDIEREKGRALGAVRLHALEQCSGTPFSIDEIEVTPYQIRREDVDWWFVRDMALRPLRHRRPRSFRYGIKWLTHHVLGNCFAFHFDFRSVEKSMLFFGNLTGEVPELRGVDKVDLLALPYCPANQKWVEQTAFLIERFASEAVLVHHFDNFMNPFTRSEYIDLGLYRREVLGRCPAVRLVISKFCREVDLTALVEAESGRAAS